MSRMKTTVSRLLAIGGLTVASGSTLAYYRYSLLGDAECRPHAFAKTGPVAEFKDTDAIVTERVSKSWDDDWDRRKLITREKRKTTEEQQPPIVLVNKDGEASTVTSSPAPEVIKPTATRHVILVRHGQYEMDHKDRNKKVLTQLGREQAAVTGDRLKALDIKFNRMTISTMVRAQETGNIIGEKFPELPKEHCSLLQEGAPYPPVPSSKAWTPDRSQTFFQDNPRIEGAFRKYIHRASPSQTEDSYDLIVCHGNVIRYFVCRALQFPPEGWLRMSTGNCGLTWLTIRPNGNVSLRNFGDTGHLPPDMVTFT